jgi:hypothetical protein
MIAIESTFASSFIGQLSLITIAARFRQTEVADGMRLLPSGQAKKDEVWTQFYPLLDK